MNSNATGIIRYFYIREERTKFPRGCIAIKAINDDKKCDKFWFGYSVFNPHDRFDRKRGRAIAAGRLMKEAMRKSQTPVTGACFNEVFKEVCRVIELNDPTVSPSTRYVAQRNAEFLLGLLMTDGQGVRKAKKAKKAKV